jgi:hypothetical protein
MPFFRCLDRFFTTCWRALIGTPSRDDRLLDLSGGSDSGQVISQAKVNWYRYLERCGRGRDWDPPDRRILLAAAELQSRRAPPPPPKRDLLGFAAVDGVASYDMVMRRAARPGPRPVAPAPVEIDLDQDFSPIEEVILLDLPRRRRRDTLVHAASGPATCRTG